MIRKLIYLVGVFFVNSRVRKHYKRLKISEKKSLDELKSEQFTRLKELISIAYNNSSFYRELYNDNNITPSDIKKLDDIKKLPIVTKTDLLRFNSEIHTNLKGEKLIFSETSGSTGESLSFRRSKDWDASTRAAMFRGYSWFGVNPWDRNGYFWGYNLSESFKLKLLDFLQNRFRIFSYDRNSIKSFSKKLKKANFLEGYSSMIYEVAKIINQEGLSGKFNLKMIKGTSEKIYDSYHSEVIKAFGKKIISEYGSAETGLIAFECAYGNMHITMENVIVEVDNDEIIVTNLFSSSFPIIRYKLGDYVKLAGTIDCQCGMKHDVIAEVCGRTGQVIRGNRQNFPSLILYYIFKNIAIQNNLTLRYQVIQKEKGKLIFRIKDKLDNKTIQLIKNESYKYFKDDITCEVIDNIEAIRGAGKLKDFISEI